MIAISPVEGGMIMPGLADDAALAVRGVRQVVNEGDLIAVIADDTWAAMKGMKALAPRWKDGPHAAVQQASIVAELEDAVHGQGAGTVSNGKPTLATGDSTQHLAALHHQLLRSS